MDRALLGDLQKLRSLLAAQRPSELNIQLDPVDLPFLGLAFRAVLCMDPRMPKLNSDVLKWPAFALGIHRDGYRRARAQGRVVFEDFPLPKAGCNVTAPPLPQP
jgi:hypothetical protein